ncbi:MAG: cytochrome c [Candidatus Cloacimonadota bacterium]|jgi:signal transduction histidine kinase|nr:cytochrome c [Candidatus Cloacimonadota bacterium]
MKFLILIFSIFCFITCNARTAKQPPEMGGPIFNKVDPEISKSAGSGFVMPKKRAHALTAKDLVLMAEKFWQEYGKEKSKIVFMRPTSQFFYQDLYLCVLDMEGKAIVHGQDPSFVDKNLYNLKDSKGNYFIKEILELMQRQDSGWITYYWRNYETHEIEKKKAYLKRVGNYIIGCGAYVEN